ncbi:MAG: aspartate aminotransferase family protein [Chromatiales bacterium]|nr:MAG: aspartate aminotransferase family protein [Chromatiales bacterium]
MNDKDQPSYHMDLEEFRQNAYRTIDWVVDYLANVESYPVLSQAEPNEVRRQLPAEPPEKGEGYDAMLRDMTEIVLPGITHWQSPNFFAFFPANSSPPAILGEILSAGLGVQGMSWATSPACTELETHMMDWLVQMLGLPERYASHTDGGGVIQHSASDATLCALLAARERTTGGGSNKAGCDGQLVAYTSAQAHSSIEKACMIAGIGTENLRLVDVDENFAMRPEALDAQIRADKAAGLVPFFVCTCVGTTSSLALDPVAEVAKVTSAHELWLHVDAAMAGTAAICPEFRFINDGVESADSYTFNPHKWMFTNFDCNAFFVADRAALISALSILPEYLRNQATDSGAVFDYRDWHVPLGRRFRAIKLWFVIRYYGVQGLQHHIREHVALAQEFKQWVIHSDDFELGVDTPLNLVCFRHRDGDAVTEQIMHTVNRGGDMYLTHTRLDDHFTLRMSIGQTNTQRRHVTSAWEQLQAVASAVTGS